MTEDLARRHTTPTMAPRDQEPSVTTILPRNIQEAERLILTSWQDRRRIRLTPTLDEPGPVILSLDRLNRIVTLNVEDAVAILEAGVPVRAIRDAAADVGLWCPALRHLPDDEPVGVAVAGGHGGRSRGYPALADFLLGSVFVCPSVGAVRHGGTAIKNASGYNLTALLAGSRGSFGIILSINLRLVPLPRARERRAYQVARSEAATVASVLAGTELAPVPFRFDADSVLTRLRPNQTEAEVLVEISDASRDAVAARAERLDALAIRHGARATVLGDWTSRPPGERLQRAVPPSQLAEHVAAVLASFTSNLTELRFEATGGGIEAWVADPTAAHLSYFARSPLSSQLRESFRMAFDPLGLLGDEHPASQ